MSKENIWIHVSNIYEAFFTVVLANNLRGRYNIGITYEKSESIKKILEKIKTDMKPVKERGWKTPHEKIKKYVTAVKKLYTTKIVQNATLCINYSSPAAARTAFGLAKPIITVLTPPVEVKQVKLTGSLSDVIIIPKPYDDYLPLNKGILKTYDGIPEMVWESTEGEYTGLIKPLDFTTVEKRLVVVTENLIKLAKNIVERTDEKIVRIDASKEQGVTINRRSLTLCYIPSVLYAADLTVSDDPYISRASAVIGVKTIHFGADKLVEKMSYKGFPIAVADDGETLKDLISALDLSKTTRIDIAHLLHDAQNPIEIISQAINELRNS
ncbi:MAG: hypothetical protein B6U94_08485 [Thermofilum sp. ex4484_79]|nr:MAG: hypothetical protein B6U94_08485 [Thermofilum sp. ex4484_79]